MAEALVAAIQTLSRQTSCASCGKPGTALKRCPVCKQAWYCGAECQNAAWKQHRKTCAPPLSLDDVWEKMRAAGASDDWREVLKWEGRMEELMAGQSDHYRSHWSDERCNAILLQFEIAHSSLRRSTGSTDHTFSLITLEGRRVELLGKMQRFRDQGELMCSLASNLRDAGRQQEAGGWCQKARDVGAAHGFFSVECRACLGLGQLAMGEGRQEEGLDLLRNSLVASPLSDHEENYWERPVLKALIEALFMAAALDEVEPLISRYREAPLAGSARDGRLSDEELLGLVFRARLHEVPCI
jgi:hypothetical protein